eukprot:3575407-Pyramimonas_sp.AAC.1
MYADLPRPRGFLGDCEPVKGRCYRGFLGGPAEWRSMRTWRRPRGSLGEGGCDVCNCCYCRGLPEGPAGR